MSDGLQQFRWAVLGAWENDRTAACSAAAEAMYAAVVLHADKPKGTVLVAVPHQPDVRSVATYLTAFLTDAPQLSRVLHKIGTDGEVMVAGKRILILPTVTSRRPRNILANVEMADTVDAVVELKSDAEIARTVAHILLIESNGGNGNAEDHRIALEIASILVPDGDPEAVIQSFGKRDDDGRDEHRWAAWRAAQGPIHRGSSLEGLDQFQRPDTSKTPILPHGPIDASGYYTAEHEHARMERIEKASMDLLHKRQAPLIGPRRRR
jgi:hypothetical protein